MTNLLKQRNYVGTLVWGRTSAFLGGQVKRNPPREWIICNDAFEAIIESNLFEKAQVIFSQFTCNLSNDEILDRLRVVLSQRGKLSSEIIQESRCCPGLTTYYKRIGGLLNAYTRLGYLRPDLMAEFTSRQRLMLIRNNLIVELIKQSGGELQEFRSSRVYRALLKRRHTGLLVSVVLVRCYSGCGRSLRWIVQPPMSERKRVSVLAFLDASNSRILQIRVFPRISNRKNAMHVAENSRWLNLGLLLQPTTDILSVIDEVRSAKPCRIGCKHAPLRSNKCSVKQREL